MDSQQTANSVAEPTSDHGETMVKPNASLPPQGFQVRPQGPPPSPRNSINNGPVGAPRPGPPLRRLDSRSSLGPPPTSGQFVQLRPYGPPRPPGSSFSPRSPQPGQLPPQNPLLSPNQRFPYSPGIRGPSPQGASGQQRPPFVINQQAYQAQQQQQQQQQQRSGNDPRFQRPDIAPSQNGPRRSSQESVFPRQLLRNDSSLSLQRQHLLSNEEIKQPARPRIVIEKMADINETNLDKPEGYLQRKNDENDDDDDVVMDNEKSPRHNGEDAPEGLVNGSKSPLTPRKVDDSRPASRPGTATIEDKAEKMDDKRDAPSRPISANIDDTATLVSQSRPSSAVNNDKEEKKEESLDSRPPSSKEINVASMSEEIKKPSSPHDDTFEGTEQSLKTPSKSSEHSRSATPSHLDAEQDKNSDRSRSSTPARLEPSDNTEQESKTPVKTSDKSRSNTPVSLEASGNAEQESRTPELKTPDKSRSSTPASQLAPSPNAERESETAARTPNRSRSSTPRAGIESSNDEAFAGTENPSENPHRDKSADTLQVKEPSRPASSLSLTSERGGKSPRSPTTPRSPEGVKGYDNGQQRSLSASGSPRLPNSPKSPISEKQTEDGKKRTSFVEDSAEKIEEIANQTAAAMTKPATPTPKTPRAQTPSKLDIEKAEKKKAVQNGSPSESQVSGTPTTNGVGESPTKKSKEVDKRSNAGSPTKSTKSLPRTPDTPSSTAQEKKKLPMNKIQVGAAPSPNLKTVRSKIGSLDNASYKPGGGKVKIENRKLDFGSKAQPKIAAKNEKYTPSGGDKKIAQVKLQWNAKPKVGSLENATYKPGGGDKKIETVKLDFKDKAKPKVGSKENAKHVPGGGSVKSATPPKTPQETKNDIPTQKIEIKAESKIGSLDNVKHKPGGGDKKIFNDRDYLRQTSSNVESLNGSGSQVQTPVRDDPNSSKANDNEIPQPQPPPSTPTKTRGAVSPSPVVTPQAVRSGLAKSPEATTPRKQLVQEMEDSTNEHVSATPSPDVIHGRSTPKSRSSGRSPTSPRPPSSLRVRSAGDESSPGTPRKTSSPGTPSRTYSAVSNRTSPGTPRKTPSPKDLRLPKLASSPVRKASTAVTETHSKITLPKLIESSSQSTRMAY